MIYFSSDLHFGHNRDFIYKSRGFENIEQHNNAILNNILQTCSSDDQLYILGDLMLNDNEDGIRLLNRLSHIPKYIIIGNHDTNTRIKLYKNLVNTTVLGYAHRFNYKGYSFYLSHYPTLTSNHDDNKPLKRRIINLCGHLHTTDRFCDFDKGIIYHVEVDAHSLRPVFIDTIIDDIRNHH